MTSPEPRFVRVSRRAFLARSAAVGGLLAVPALACAKSDEEVFASATTTTAVPGTAAPATATTSTTTPPRTSSTTSSTSSTTTTSTTQAPTSGGSFPDGAELVVSFTFAAAGGGRVNNPYIAVWVEDPDGNLVDTISLWFEQGKGVRWLPDLRRWYAASDGGDDTTMSGATRVAGSYTVAWDGTDLDGNAVPAGDYVLHIEAAREHGPYELVTGDLTIGAEPFQVTLTPSGELTAASAELKV
jgi:hypothetical protein